MLKQLFGNKNHWLLAGTIVLAMNTYYFAIKKTVASWKLHKKLINEFVKSEDIKYQPGYLLRKNQNLAHAIELYSADTALYRSSSINIISLIAEKEHAKLSAVPMADASYETKNTLTQKVEFDGDYFSLLKLSSKLQTSKGIGIIRSEEWKLRKVRNDNKVDDILDLNLYLEILKK